MQSLFVRRWVVLFMKEKANRKEVTQTLTRSQAARLEFWPLERCVRARKAEGSGCWRSRKSLVLQVRKHNTFVLSLNRGTRLGHRWGKPTVAGPPPFPLLLCMPTATKWYVLWVNLLGTIIFSSSGWSPALELKWSSCPCCWMSWEYKCALPYPALNYFYYIYLLFICMCLCASECKWW